MRRRTFITLLGGAAAAWLAKRWAERDALFTKRAALPPHERADVDARIEAIVREIAEIAAPGRRAVLDLINSR